MPTGKTAQSGFTYLLVLMLIALIGMGLAAAGTLWRTEAQRDHEADLLFIGDQYREAIRSYYELDPAQPRLPQSIDDLLEDNRRPNIVRHLRRAWRDPLTNGEFALIREPDTQGIVGVYSPAPGRPFKTAGFSAKDEAFKDAKSYARWRFVMVLPPRAPAAQTSPQKPPESSVPTAPRAGNAGR
ncbi:type II secretion system protein [Thiobacillus sp.]